MYRGAHTASLDEPSHAIDVRMSRNRGAIAEAGRIQIQVS